MTERPNFIFKKANQDKLNPRSDYGHHNRPRASDPRPAGRVSMENRDRDISTENRDKGSSGLDGRWTKSNRSVDDKRSIKRSRSPDVRVADDAKRSRHQSPYERSNAPRDPRHPPGGRRRDDRDGRDNRDRHPRRYD